MSQSVFDGVEVQAKKEGKGIVRSTPHISLDDLALIGACFYVDHVSTPHPKKLQQAVLFYIMYFFCQRGQENLYHMKKNTPLKLLFNLMAPNSLNKQLTKRIKITVLMIQTSPIKQKCMNSQVCIINKTLLKYSFCQYKCTTNCLRTNNSKFFTFILRK